MKPKRKQRLILIGLVACGLSATAALSLIALEQNIDLFFSPSQVVAGKVPENIIFRIGGIVVNDSVKRNANDLTVQFKLTDTAETIPVTYTGILPDLFREGQSAIAKGKMINHIFQAEQVLAKHDENYMPPEIDDALKAADKSTQ